jgi:hypothetical protein
MVKFLDAENCRLQQVRQHFGAMAAGAFVATIDIDPLRFGTGWGMMETCR